MSQLFETYLKKVVQQMDGPMDEKLNVKEELLSHLQQSKEEFMEEGYGEEQAELFALENFGNAKSIGNDMQQAMFPYRKLFLQILGFLSFFTIICVYIAALIVDRDAFIGWLLLSVLTSALFLLFSGQIFPKLERNSVLIGLSIIHILLLMYGYGIISQIDNNISIPLSFLVIANVIFAIFLIYRIVLYDYPFPPLSIKIIHIVNITCGVIYISASLFFIWVMLAFIQGAGPFSIIPLSLLLVWILSYFIQIKLMNHRKKKVAFSVLGLTHITILGLLWLFLVN